MTARSDVAAFIADELESGKYIGKVVFIASRGRKRGQVMPKAGTRTMMNSGRILISLAFSATMATMLILDQMEGIR